MTVYIFKSIYVGGTWAPLSTSTMEVIHGFALPFKQLI